MISTTALSGDVQAVAPSCLNWRLASFQESLVMELDQPPETEKSADGIAVERAKLLVLAATEEEATLHAKALAAIESESKGKCLWLKLDGEAADAG